MANSNHRKIKNYLINPQFQLSFIGNMLVLALVVVGVILGANLYFFNLFNQLGADMGLPDDHVFFRFVDLQFDKMTDIFLILATALVLLIVVQGFRFSHKIAGPLYRLNEDLKAMGSSKSLKYIKFRKGDYFTEIPDTFNHVVDRLSDDSGK